MYLKIDSQKSEICHQCKHFWRLSRLHESGAQNKFKKLISNGKSFSLTPRFAIGISRYWVEKVYKKCWDVLFLLVDSQGSLDPSNKINPSFETVDESLASKVQSNEVTKI